jgi:hypothetical protein
MLIVNGRLKRDGTMKRESIELFKVENKEVIVDQ